MYLCYKFQFKAFNCNFKNFMTNLLLDKKFSFWIQHISELINLWNSENNLASNTKKRYFNGKRYLGSKDKKIISGSFYFYLRTLLYTKSLTIHELLYLTYNKVEIVKSSIDYFFKENNFNTYIYTHIKNQNLLSEFDNLPASTFFPHIFSENINLGKDELELLFQSLNQEATTDLRIISNKNMVLQELIDNDVFFYFNFINGCVKLEKNINFRIYDGYNNSYFEIQDEGSQLVSIVLDPKKDDRILDYCSGGGGKTTHIAELSDDLANIIATDINLKRLLETKRRAEKQNLKSIRILPKYEVDSNNQKFNKILVDAPCSGSGTVRRSPEIRYSINQNTINKYAKLQLEILENCYNMLENGGEMVYSTCSLFHLENDDVINAFLSLHKNLNLVNLQDRLVGLDIDINKIHFTLNGMMTLTNRTNTDGFFISILKKSE